MLIVFGHSSNFTLHRHLDYIIIKDLTAQMGACLYFGEVFYFLINKDPHIDN